MSKILGMLVLLAAVAAFGCGGDSRDYSGSGDSGTDGDTDGDSDGDSDGDGDSDTDQICDEQNFNITQQESRVLLLMDHSSSMAGGNWDIARSAVNSLLTTFDGSTLEFGLDTLPDPSGANCAVSEPIPVDCGPDTGTDISDALAGMTTYVSTPLWAALNSYLTPSYAPGCAEEGYNHYIILIADGEDSCGGTSGQITSTTIALVAAGIKVIVVGFNVNMSSEQLNAIAANGGTTFTTYLNANDEPTLIEALNSIGTAIVDCVFTIDEPDATADPDLVNFYFDGELIYMDEDCSSGSGWHWANDDHTQVEFCPDSCDLISNGDVELVTATFGCTTVIE